MESKTGLEDRLIAFAVQVVILTQGMPRTDAGRYYGGQLLRSSGSTALNYGEAQGGETHRDFTHKLKIVRKELRESYNCIRIIIGAGLHSDQQLLSAISKETQELVAIFTAAVKTAENRSGRLKG